VSSETIYQSRKEARDNGAKRYHGKPCKRCGTTEKNVRKAECILCEQARVMRYKHAHPPQRSDKEIANSKVYRESMKGRAQFLFHGAKSRARNRVPFTITRDDIERLLQIAEQKWKEIGIDFDYSVGHGRRRAFTPSLDQIRAGEGYRLNNIQIVPWAWNALKQDHFTDAQAIDFCERIAAARRLPQR
jgi:hypothetical protein